MRSMRITHLHRHFAWSRNHQFAHYHLQFIDSLYRGRILGFDDETEFRCSLERRSEAGRNGGKGKMERKSRRREVLARNCTVLEDYDIFQRFPRLSHYIGVPNFPWLSLMGMLWRTSNPPTNLLPILISSEAGYNLPSFTVTSRR